MSCLRKLYLNINLSHTYYSQLFNIRDAAWGVVEPSEYPTQLIWNFGFCTCYEIKWYQQCLKKRHHHWTFLPSELSWRHAEYMHCSTVPGFFFFYRLLILNWVTLISVCTFIFLYFDSLTLYYQIGKVLWNKHFRTNKYKQFSESKKSLPTS